jgi:hypothetical protein
MALRDSMIDAPVFTQDGTEIGKVKEIQGAFFKIDAPMEPDYWLRDDGVVAEGNDVRLPFDADVLDVLKLGEPEANEPAVHGVASDPGPQRPIGTEDDVWMAEGVGGTPWTDVSSRYRREWELRSGATGDRWEDYEPGYRYGFEMANEPHYAGRGFTEAEEDLRRDYRDWSMRNGYAYDDNAWERFKDAIRTAFSGTSSRRAA